MRPSAFAVLRLNTDLREKVPTWAQSRFYQIGAGSMVKHPTLQERRRGPVATPAGHFFATYAP
jgi:hypothetical protein